MRSTYHEWPVKSRHGLGKSRRRHWQRQRPKMIDESPTDDRPHVWPFGAVEVPRSSKSPLTSRLRERESPRISYTKEPKKIKEIVMNKPWCKYTLKSVATVINTVASFLIWFWHSWLCGLNLVIGASVHAQLTKQMLAILEKLLGVKLSRSPSH